MATPVGAGDRPGDAPANVLVLGGTGFIGSEVAAAFLARGARVTVLARHPVPERRAAALCGAEVVLGDAGDRGTLAHLLDRSDHVVHAVGCPNPTESNEQPADQVALTVLPLIALLEALRARPRVGLTFCSSGGTVYGEVPAVPVHESRICEPISAYGVAKLSAERWVGMYARRYDLHARVVRIANAYGPTQDAGRGQGVVAAFLAAARNGRTATLFGDGRQVRDYVHVHDVARAVAELAATRSGPAVVNVGSGRGHSVEEVLQTVRRVTACTLPVERLPERDFDVHSIILDVERLRELVDWDPVGLETGVAGVWADWAAAGQDASVPQLAAHPA